MTHFPDMTGREQPETHTTGIAAHTGSAAMIYENAALRAENTMLRQQLADAHRRIDEWMRSHSQMAVKAGKRNQ